MKKIITTVVIIATLGLLVSLAFSKESKVVEQTDLQRYKIELNKYMDQRAHHLKMVKQYEYKMIQINAVIEYIQEKEELNKEKK